MKFICFLLFLLSVSPVRAEGIFIAVDVKTEKVLLQKKSDNLFFPASLVKVMTLYKIFEALEAGKVNNKTKIKISANAADKPSTNMSVSKGETITVEKAVQALAIHSANDVATAVGEFFSGKEEKFAKEMTQTARELGMLNTVFKNASGLYDYRQYSTARDMAVLAVNFIRRFPDEYTVFSKESFVFKGKKYKTHNTFISFYKGADGIKTGYIKASGHNLMASAVKGKRRLVGVLFGTDSPKQRDKKMKEIMNKAFAKAEFL